MTDGVGIDGLADALGNVRRQIRTLEAREKALRKAILQACPNRGVSGREFVVEVREQKRRRFNHRALPAHLRDDPRFWSSTICKVLVTRAQPKPRASRDCTLSAEENLDVLEEF